MADSKHSEILYNDYCLEKYFNRYFVPVMRSEADRYIRKQQEELRSRNSAGWFAPDAASPFAVTDAYRNAGKWNRKTVDDFMESVNDRFFSNKKVQEDIVRMTASYEGALVKSMGRKSYDALCRKLGGDVAEIYVYNRYAKLFMSHLAKLQMPRSTVDYLVRNYFNSSFISLFKASEWSSELKDDIKNLSIDYWNANFGEKTLSYTFNYLSDALLLGGVGKVTKGTVATVGGIEVAGNVAGKLGKWLSDEVDLDEEISKSLGHDAAYLDSLRKSVHGKDFSAVSYVQDMNKGFRNKIVRPRFSESSYKRFIAEIRRKYGSSDVAGLCEYMSNSYRKLGVRLDTTSAYPSWMKEKSSAELYQLATGWCARAAEMKDKGMKVLVIGKKKYTFEEICQKSYDYARAFKDRGRSIEKKGNELLSSLESSAGVSSSAEIPKVPSAPASLGNVASQPLQSVSSPSVGERQTHQVRSDTSSVAGWGSMLNGLGLDGFGNVGKNLGSVLAMLPEMLVGMFTGRAQNLRFKDNLWPIASIVFGMFVHNPLLKLLFVGLGGANLLNKAGKEALGNVDKGNTRSNVVYRRYSDEPLDARLKDPAVKGNILFVTVDGVPGGFTVSDDAIDAYYKGYIPLNTFANAVLRKYDEQRAITEGAINNMEMDNERKEGRGLGV